MLTRTAFRPQPTLTGELIRLEPLRSTVLEDYLVAVNDPDVRRFTGTHGSFDRQQIKDWLATRPEHHDRADWAVIRRADDAFIGEVVLNEYDPVNESANYRIWLGGPALFGNGYGTEATRLAIDYAIQTIGLHRVTLGVYDFNGRARRVYEKCGFKVEGRLRESLLCDGQWFDEVLMSVLAPNRTSPGFFAHR